MFARIRIFARSAYSLAFGLVFFSSLRLFECAIWLTPGARRVFWDPRDFSWTRILEAMHAGIKQEFLAIRGVTNIPPYHELSDQQRALTTHGFEWKTFVLVAYGHKVAGNLERCPNTAQALMQVPGLSSAMFSILSDEAVIKPHVGPYKGVLRYHLGVIVPKPEEHARICVSGIHRSWFEGESLVFDDTFMHEVIKNNRGDRVVLFIDIERPLPWPMAKVNRFFVRMIGGSPFVREILHNIDRWDDALSNEVEPMLEAISDVGRK